MVVDGPQVEAMLLGPAGVVEGAAPGTLCVDMSTIAPADTRRIGAALAEREIAFVDAPVTGSSPRAQDGTLTIMAGGTTADFERARALFDVMGKLVVHVGELGQGQTVKLINNAVAATNLSTLAQALIVGRATGVDLDALMTIMGAGSGGSAMLDLKGQPLVDHDYSTLFKLEHMLKDVRLCLEEGQAAGVPFPAAAHTREVLTAGMGRGLGDADFAAMLDVLEALADTRL
jgi:3-hydroxyisobutyrate dehydrogenase-like beta-hydroxyacid dehydrogenase